MRLFIIGSLTNVEFENYPKFCEVLGEGLATNSMEILVCSPFPDSVDSKIILGVRKSVIKKVSVELYYPRLREVEVAWNQLLDDAGDNLKIRKFEQEAPTSTDPEHVKYAWLFAQIQGMSTSDFILVVGGKLGGSANFLVRIADAQRKNIIPLPKFGGLGELLFERKRFQLTDFWGPEHLQTLSDCADPLKLASLIANGPSRHRHMGANQSRLDPTFFISYSREKPSDADFVEMILRRRNYNVLRDEHDLSAGEDIPNAIKERILKSDVFISLWCKEYACSPWCFDEFSIALESHLNVKDKSLWILRTDKTRMIHPAARNRIYYDTESREDLEGRVLNLLGQLN